MKILYLLFALALNHLAFSQNQLAYQWIPNSEYSFKATSNDNMSMGGSMMGMDMMAMSAEAMNFKTESVFTLRIEKVLPNGSADGTFYLQKLAVSDDKGNKLATLASIPKKALVAPFTVDTKGNFTFRQVPILLCRENTTLLVSAKVKPGEMAASAEMDGEKVSLFAEFNPKTGTLKAGYSAQTLSKPSPKPVVVKEDDETIDLIPTDFLDLLILPDGPVSEGQVIKSKMYGFEMVEKVTDFSNEVASLDFKFNSGMNARQFEKDAKAMDPNGAEDMEMEEGMETPNMGQEMNGDIKLVFDNGKGMMQKLSGTIVTKTNMMGMEMTTKSTLMMVPVVK